MDTVPTPTAYDPQRGLNSDERFLLHVIISGSSSLDERIERVESLRARDVITGGECQHIRRALEMDQS